MKYAYYFRKEGLESDARFRKLMEGFRASGCEVYRVQRAADVSDGTQAVLSLGGDGTFLAAARISVSSGVPVLGINFGRLGFLSECEPSSVVGALMSGGFEVETRSMLKVEAEGFVPEWPYALNEVAVSRAGAAMLGVDVALSSQILPTYWADGLLVATSSGSTAYSLSVGGPICLPDSKVLIVSPIAPHNLNVRPLIVPQETVVDIGLRTRSGSVLLSIDDEFHTISPETRITVRAAEVALRRIRLRDSNFINALRSRLLWGQDVRNSGENQ